MLDSPMIGKFVQLHNIPNENFIIQDKLNEDRYLVSHHPTNSVSIIKDSEIKEIKHPWEFHEMNDPEHNIDLPRMVRQPKFRSQLNGVVNIIELMSSIIEASKVAVFAKIEEEKKQWDKEMEEYKDEQ